LTKSTSPLSSTVRLEELTHAIAFPADWHQYGRSAGPIRNYKMLKEGQPDCVIAFLHENSRGTRHMIEIARKADIEVKVINI